jgi:hypothetical protein
MSGIDRISIGKEFHLKEYEFLKQEIAELVDHSRKLEIYAIGAIAAFYAWFIKAHPAPVALLIPTALALLGWLRSYAALVRIYEIADYLREMERTLTLNKLGLCGWESYRKAMRGHAPGSIRSRMYAAPFLSSAAVFWIALILVSGLLWCFPQVLEEPHASGTSAPTIKARNTFA